MQIYKKKKPDDEESIGLLTSLLVRYPELCTINYLPRGHLLRLSFILKIEIEKPSFIKYKNELIECISTYYVYEGHAAQPGQISIKHHLGPGTTIIEVTRDTATLSQKEIELIVNYTHEQFPEDIVCDRFYITEDDLVEHDDYIGYMLESIRFNSPKNKFVALREEGRVLVFKR